MKGISRSQYLQTFIFCGYLSIVSSQPREGETRKIGCQHKSDSGRSYAGEANRGWTLCQKWSDTQPHNHGFTHVGDHNFCRNPNGGLDGYSQTQVWCYTTNPKYPIQLCPVPFCRPLGALDFSLDVDQKPDENNSYTHASLQIENFPSSFTICTAFMVEAWDEDVDSYLFVLYDDKGEVWFWVRIYAVVTYTEFSFQIENSPPYEAQSAFLFYPLQWTRVCISRDSNTSVVRLVVDGDQLLETDWKVKNQPDNLDIKLGKGPDNTEYPGRTTNLNIFSSALSVEQMKMHTSPGKEDCGHAGDFLDWDKSLREERWTLHSKARLDKLNRGLESPCMTKASMNVFPMIEDHFHNDCMDLCSKLGGQSPPVRTKLDWENLLKEIKAISPEPSRLPDQIWLSATEGDIGQQVESPLELGELDHWPEGTKAKEGFWRDYYTGVLLENYTKPWESSNGDRDLKDTYNCIIFYPKVKEVSSWKEWQCRSLSRGCPCTYETRPVIHLRGFCPGTLVEHYRYTMVQPLSDPMRIIMVIGWVTKCAHRI